MKIYIDNTLDINESQKKLASEFCLFCAEKLPIEGDFNIYMVSQREPHNITTTALYEVGNNTCRVYCKKRSFVDCMRSIAHEMTHMMQDQMGILTGHIRDAGGFHEDQANAKAGELIKLFAKSKPHRKTIYENKTILSKRILFS